VPEEAKPGAAGPEGERRKPRVTTPRKAGVVGKAVDAIVAPLSAVRPPELDWKLVSWGLLVLIAIILVARNWAPVRINIFGWYLDMPKALAFLLFFVLGGLTMWLIDLRVARRRRMRSVTEAAPSAAAGPSTGADPETPVAEPALSGREADELPQPNDLDTTSDADAEV